jgi:hypothetical protein
MNTFKDLLTKVEKVSKEKKLDLSSGEDLSIGVMNLIGAEEHLFYTYEKTKNHKYIELLNEVRTMRTSLMKDLITDYEGEAWCIGKHLLSASMRVMEVGTKELKKNNEDKAKDLFDKSFKLYSLFWGLVLKTVKGKDIAQMEDNLSYVDEKGVKKDETSVFGKLEAIVKKALDCCKE